MTTETAMMPTDHESRTLAMLRAATLAGAQHAPERAPVLHALAMVLDALAGGRVALAHDALDELTAQSESAARRSR